MKCKPKMTDMEQQKRDIREVANLHRPAPRDAGEYTGRIVTERIGRLWKAGYEINTPTEAIIAPLNGCLTLFESEYKAVYDAIRCIKRSLLSFRPEHRGFLVDLCDVAFDSVNPTLF